MSKLSDKIWFHKVKDEFRCYLHWGDTCWHYEGYLFKNARHNSIGLKLGGDENDITFNLGISKLFNFYIGVENLFPRKLMSRLFGYTSRHYGISLFEEYISIEFHRDDMGYSDKWKGYHKMIDWKSILFGKQTYQKEELGEERKYIEMPEGNYLATVRKFQSTWSRKRFIKPITSKRFEITPDISIPEPGKGENSWDCGDDALVSMTIEAESTEDALKKVAESVIKTRAKRSGVNWKPKNGFEVTA